MLLLLLRQGRFCMAAAQLLLGCCSALLPGWSCQARRRRSLHSKQCRNSAKRTGMAVVPQLLHSLRGAVVLRNMQRERCCCVLQAYNSIAALGALLVPRLHIYLTCELT